MAVLHVDSTGSNTAPYETWTKAATALLTACAAAAAGDTVYVATVHTENPAGNTIACTNGTAAAPLQVICGVKDTGGDNAGISSLATTTRATIGSSTTVWAITGHANFFGLSFETNSGSSTTSTLNTAAGLYRYFENCVFRINGTGSASVWTAGKTTSGESSQTTFIDCQFDFSSTAQRLGVNGDVFIRGGSMVSGTSAVAALVNFAVDSRGGICEIIGFDFTNLGSALNIFDATGPGVCRARNCKMPASWSGSVSHDNPGLTGTRLELINCDDADTNYKFELVDSNGKVTDETTIKRTAGGASDGTTSYTMRMATTADCVYPGSFLRSPPIVQRLASGGAKTATVEIVHDGASAFTDKEIWLEVEYLGTSGFPMALFVSDRANLVTTAAAQASSSEAWNGDSGTGPNGSATWNTLKLVSPSFTANESGYVIGTVCMAVASKTAFVDPKMTIA